jgi:hypothetical protein
MHRLLAATIATGLIASPAGAADVRSSADLPPALQALEAKMAQLNITSERFLRLERGNTVTVINTGSSSNGRVHTRVKHASVNTEELGEISLSPAVGELFGGADLTEPQAIAAGSTLYTRVPKRARLDCGRPWVRLQGGAAGLPLPFHGSSREVNMGGIGPYAGLINLLATATGPVSTVGPAVVEGQATTEFTANVDPLLLIEGVTPKEHVAIERHVLSVTLGVFIAESGLPLRVVTQIGVGSSRLTQTVEILAVDIPVSVKPPPARQTIGEQQFARRLTGKHISCPAAARRKHSSK